VAVRIASAAARPDAADRRADGYSESDPAARTYAAAFVQGLASLGWSEGRNLRIDFRWAVGDVDRMRSLAKELAQLRPDTILANTTPITVALAQETHTIPIVFVIVSDPVGAGLVQPGLTDPYQFNILQPGPGWRATKCRFDRLKRRE
jgi:ABC transporter substrate binding protein